MKKEYVTWLVIDEQLAEGQEIELTIRDLTPGREKYNGRNVKAIVSSSPDRLPEGDILWIRSGTGVLHPPALGNQDYGGIRRVFISQPLQLCRPPGKKRLASKAPSLTRNKLRRGSMEQQEWQYKNMHTILKEKAESQGSKVYIESPDQGKSITYEQTYAMCNKIANFLKEKGMKVNDKVALISENSIETLLIYLGVLNYGAIVSPINVEESKENVYHLLNRAKPRIVIYGKGLTFDEDTKRISGYLLLISMLIADKRTNFSQC